MKDLYIHELYVKLLDYINTTYVYKDGRNPVAQKGICEMMKRCVDEGIFVEAEYLDLSKHFHKNKPFTDRNKDFYDPEHAYTIYWWETGAYEVRIAFLEMLIEKTKL